MAANSVKVTITAEDQASAKLKNVGDEAEKSGGKLGGLGDSFKAMGTIVGALQINQVFNSALDSVKSFVGGSVGAASDIAESTSKVKTILGESASALINFAETSASSFGVSKAEALGAGGAFANLFTGLGLAAPAAGDMSVKMVQLAADLASFHNIPISEALEKMRAGLVGEAEPMRALGVLMNEGSVSAAGMAMGLGDATGKMTDAEKVQARYSLIMQQTAVAQGDVARTSGGLANQTKFLEANMADLQAQIGAKLLPVQLALTKALLEFLPKVEAAARWLARELGPAVGDVADIVRTELLPAVRNVADATATAIREMRQHWDTIGPAVEAALAPVFAIFGVLASQLEVVADVFRGFAALLRGDWSNAWKFFANAALAMIEAMVNPIIDGFNLIVKAYNATVGKLPGMPDAPEIPEFKFRFSIEGPVAGGGFLGGIMDDVQKVMDGIVDLTKKEAPRIPAAIADGIKAGGGGGARAVEKAIEEVLAPIPDEIIDLANHAKKALALFSEGFEDEAQHLMDEDALGRAGARVMDELVIALTTGSDKALGAVGAGLAEMVDEVRQHEDGGAEAASAFSKRLTDAMNTVIRTGGREGVADLRKVLEDMNAVLDSEDAEKVFNGAKTFSEALTEALFNEDMRDRLGTAGADILLAIQEGMAEKDDGLLASAAEDASSLIETWEDELGGPRANTMGKQFKELLLAYVQSGSDAALGALKNFFAAANAELEKAKASIATPGVTTEDSTWNTVNWGNTTKSEFTTPTGEKIPVYATATGWTTGDKTADEWISKGQPGQTLDMYRAMKGQNAGGGYAGPMAAGGIVTRPTLALIGERGPEAVVPLGRGFGNVTVNVYATGYVQDVRGLVEQIERELARSAY